MYEMHSLWRITRRATSKRKRKPELRKTQHRSASCGEMSKYGLNLRPPKPKKPPPRPSLATPFGFNDDDENDVEREIALQASKNKRLKEVEEQQKKALEEDPSVFDYDGVYDKMKAKETRPVTQDREERKPKYIENLIKKAKEREQYREIVYEKKIAKERSKDDHLYANKDKFVTEAYRKKLSERERQMELERLRELQEERDDVTKKKDFLLDFYSNLDKNVAYGAKDAQARKRDNQAERRVAETHEGGESHAPDDHEQRNGSDEVEHSMDKSSSPAESPTEIKIGEQGGASNPLDTKPIPEASSVEEKSSAEQPLASQPAPDHHKRSLDTLAAAKERFLARKKARDQ
ncbi:unnamed protein product [Sphenostylis stenocarpa]|uniref:Nuclear speckle splicing regulatory protein 1 N-terminal domain-containing protein n=1 Tax=Sphenostylis stenocarpa TaxID=92480 RepID=A0AA86W3M7_9FABA|nr:unnamed protein product [Sphenostylis stenocarpa]